VKFQVGFNQRFDTQFKKCHDMVRDEESWYTVNYLNYIPLSWSFARWICKKFGGLFIDMSIHDFDMIRYLSGQDVKDITVKASSLIDDRFSCNEDVDTAMITITFAGESLGGNW